MKKIIFYIFLLIPLLAFAQEEYGDGDEIELACGVQRWAIKVFTDPDTVLINFNNIVPTTIAEQKSIPAPPNIGTNPPRLSTETTVDQLECYIIFFKLETDQDIHLGIMSTNFQDTMVAEICDPSCPGIISTSRYQMLRTLRDWFVNTYHPTTSFQNLFLRVRLTGVGFFDTVHGQRGMAPNGREIHSVLSILPFTLNLSINLEACTMVDTVNVELRNSVSPFNLIESRKGLGGNGVSQQISFGNSVNGTPYYIVVKHRNAISTWSGIPHPFTSNTLTYNFTTAASQAFGNNMKLTGALYSFYQGDVNQDGFIELSDISAIYNDGTIFLSGYVTTDLNCDNFVDLTDLIICFNNSSNFISIIRP